MSMKDRALAKVDQATEALGKSMVAKAAIDASISLIPIPGVSGAISSAIGSRASKLAEENTRRLFEELRSEFERFDEVKLDKEFIESDEFVSILVDALTRNLRTHERQKTRLFARAFANFSSTDYSSTPHKEGFLEIIERLSFGHARAMAFLYKRSCEPLADGDVKIKVGRALTASGNRTCRIDRC